MTQAQQSEAQKLAMHLRQRAKLRLSCGDHDTLAIAAADELESLHAENEQLRAQLAAPAPAQIIAGPCGQCKDSRVPCQCALDTILRERGLIAVSRESFQHMVNKIAPPRAPACWCATCDSAASPFGIPTRMSLCPKCGDKRCPRAQHHDSDCFASPKESAP